MAISYHAPYHENAPENDSGLLFLTCGGPKGLTEAAKRQLKNRHAQSGYAASTATSYGSSRQQPRILPVQIKFKVSPDTERRRSKASQRKSNHANRREGKRCCKFPHATGQCSLRSLSETFKITDSGCVLSMHQKPVDPVDPAPLGSCIEQYTSYLKNYQPCSWNIGEAERRSLHYFINVVALDLSRYLPGRFWDELVPRQCHADPMIRDAVLALSSAHMSKRATPATSLQATGAYQRAITRLRAYINTNIEPSRSVVVLCCIVFYTFCHMIEDAIAALTHLQGGLSILGRQCAMNTTERDLSGMLVQLDMETMLKQPDLTDPLQLGCWKQEVSWNVRFHSPHEAMATSTRILHSVWRFITTNSCYRCCPIDAVPEGVLYERAQLRQWMEWWRYATKGYLQTLPALALDSETAFSKGQLSSRQLVDGISALVLELQHIAAKRMLSDCIFEPWDNDHWEKNPAKMLWYGEKIVVLKRMHQRINDLPYLAHCAATEPLMLLAQRSRVPAIRARARSLADQLTQGPKDCLYTAAA